MVLVAHYPLQEESGSTAYDIRGNNNGTNNGATQGANGILGTSAYDFDGSDDYVDCGQLGNFWNNGHSISCWVNTDTDHNGIFVSSDDDSNNTRIGQLKKKSGGKIQYNFINGNLINSTVKSNGIWLHCVGTYDGSTAKLYVNGNKEAETGTSSNTGDPNVALGVQAAGNGTNNYNGSLADVRIYDHALTASEVQYLYDVIASPSTIRTTRK